MGVKSFLTSPWVKIKNKLNPSYQLQSERMTVSDFVALVTFLIPILAWGGGFLYKESPVVILSQPSQNILEIKNVGKNPAKIVDIIFVNEKQPYCLNEDNVGLFSGQNYLNYNVDKTILAEGVLLGPGANEPLITCKECVNDGYDNLFDKISIYVKYKGEGLFLSLIHI